MRHWRTTVHFCSSIMAFDVPGFFLVATNLTNSLQLNHKYVRTPFGVVIKSIS